MLVHLDRRFDLLVDGPRTAPARHRTLGATLDWSYDALPEDERGLFCQLAVFPGSFTLDVVVAVHGDARADARTAVVRLLPRLVERSLVATLPDAGHAVRYRLLETLRAYALDRSPPAGLAVLRNRHADHHLELARAAAPALRGADQTAWLTRLQAEQPNLRAALSWTLETGDAERSCELLAALAPFWDDTGQRREAADWITRWCQAITPPAEPRGVRALVEASFLLQRSDVAQAQLLARNAVQLARHLDRECRARADLALGWSLAYAGERTAATAALTRAAETLDAERHPWEHATALQGLALATAELDPALAFAEAATDLFARVGDRHRLANIRYTMADGALNAGARLDDCQRWLLESRSVAEDLGSEHDLAHVQVGLARLAWRRGDADRTERELQGCVNRLQRLGDRRCAARTLYLLGEVAAQRGDTVRARSLFEDSAAAAAPAAAGETLAAAQHALDDLPPPDRLPG